MSTETFIQERKYLKAVSDKTLLWYKDSFKAFEGALDSTATINARIVELRKRGVKPVSVNTYLRAVKAYYLWNGKKWEVGRLKEEQKILATLSQTQVRQLCFSPAAKNNPRLNALACLALDTGIRAAEMLNLSWSQINLDSLTIMVNGKGGKQRVIPFSIECRKVLYRWRQKQKSERVFGTRNGTIPSQRNVLRDFKLLCQRLGITGVRCSLHSLRHTFAVNYLRRGGNLEFLRRILGHSSILTTQKYLRSLGVEDLQAVHSGLSLLTR